MNTRLLLATRSAGKLRELHPMFADAGFDVIDLGDAGVAPAPEEDDIECFATFEENALAKAGYFCALTGMRTIADDSGLQVQALGGAPGVRSKRWSERPELTGQALDDANNAKLMSSLDHVTDRAARYVCAAAFSDGTRRHVVRGETAGQIVNAASGAHGFGYDPYFRSDELGVTFGEATRERKERISHRGRAFRALIAELRKSPCDSVK